MQIKETVMWGYFSSSLAGILWLTCSTCWRNKNFRFIYIWFAHVSCKQLLILYRTCEFRWNNAILQWDLWRWFFTATNNRWTRRPLFDAMPLLQLQFHLLVRHPEYDIPGNQTRETRHETLVKCGRALLDEGPDSTVYRAFVLAGCAVHVTRLHHIHRTRRQSGAKSGGRRGCQVTWYPVAEIAADQNEILDDIITDYLRHVHDGVPRDVRHGSWCVMR